MKNSQDRLPADDLSKDKSEEKIYKFNKQQNKKKKTCYRSFKQVLMDYCDRSSIQGLNYLKESESIFERIWWIIVFALCIIGCVYMILEIWLKYLESPVVVNFSTKESPVYQIPFPAVTICPETKISVTCVNYTEVKLLKKKNETVDSVEDKYFSYMSNLCDLDSELSYLKSDYYDMDFLDFLYSCSSSSALHGMCRWQGELVDCDDLFVPVLTDEGMCFTFNIMDRAEMFDDKVVHYGDFQKTQKSFWSSDDGYAEDAGVETYPRRALLTGAQNALELILFTNKPDITYNCRDLGFQGHKVTLHIPSRLPRPRQQFFTVPQAQSVVAAIKPIMITTSATVKRYHPETRECYFSSEKSLFFFKTYTQNNCELECFANYTSLVCGCTPYYLPRINGSEICGLGKSTCVQNATKTYTIGKLTNKISKNEPTFEHSCLCLPLCCDISYEYQLSQTNLDWQKWIQANGEPKWFSEFMEASSLNIFFKSPHFTPTERNELYGPSDFISNFGGLLGLFTGFSLFSVALCEISLCDILLDSLQKYGP